VVVLDDLSDTDNVEIWMLANYVDLHHCILTVALHKVTIVETVVRIVRIVRTVEF